MQEPPLVRFEPFTLMTVGAIRAAGLAIRPTGRNPLHHSIEFTDLADGMSRLLRCEHRSMPGMEVRMEPEIDLAADLNARTTTATDGDCCPMQRDRSRVVVGRMLLVGKSEAAAVVRVVAVDDGGQVHFAILPGPITRTAICSTAHPPEAGEHARTASAP